MVWNQNFDVNVNGFRWQSLFQKLDVENLYKYYDKIYHPRIVTKENYDFVLKIYPQDLL